MSCGEPCDNCTSRAEHHLCDTCCHEEPERLRARVAELEAEVSRWASVTRELRQKLAIAGVEGSPPPGEETTIGALMARAQTAEAEVARLRARVAELEETTSGAVQSALKEISRRQVAEAEVARLRESEARLRAALEKTQYALRKAMNGECCVGEEYHADDCPAPRAMSESIAALSGTTPAPLSERERCPKRSRAWGVRCERDAGHEGLCVSAGDGFHGTVPAPVPERERALLKAAREMRARWPAWCSNCAQSGRAANAREDKRDTAAERALDEALKPYAEVE